MRGAPPRPRVTFSCSPKRKSPKRRAPRSARIPPRLGVFGPQARATARSLYCARGAGPSRAPFGLAGRKRQSEGVPYGVSSQRHHSEGGGGFDLAPPMARPGLGRSRPSWPSRHSGVLPSKDRALESPERGASGMRRLARGAGDRQGMAGGRATPGAVAGAPSGKLWSARRESRGPSRHRGRAFSWLLLVVLRRTRECRGRRRPPGMAGGRATPGAVAGRRRSDHEQREVTQGAGAEPPANTTAPAGRTRSEPLSLLSNIAVRS